MAKLKESIGKQFLKRKKRGVSREICVHNFTTAKSAVILFDTGNSESFKVIKEFQKFLEGKNIKVSTFGIVHQKEVPQELLFLKNFAFITRKDLNWYMKPSERQLRPSAVGGTVTIRSTPRHSAISVSTGRM